MRLFLNFLELAVVHPPLNLDLIFSDNLVLEFSDDVNIIPLQNILPNFSSDEVAPAFCEGLVNVSRPFEEGGGVGSYHAVVLVTESEDGTQVDAEADFEDALHEEVYLCHFFLFDE